MKRCVVVLLATFLARPAGAQDSPASPAPSAAPPPAASIAAAVDAAALKIVSAKGTPGIVIAVAEHGTVVLERAYGLADVARKLPVTVATRFQIGSVTKQVTAACILQLARAGKLSLDDHIGTFLPDYFIGRGVTVRELLDQTSGIPEYLTGPEVIAEAGKDPATAASLLARVSAKPLEFQPGTAWKYSSTNYILLGRIVEIAAHEPYERYVREHVFEPAGMTDTGFISDEAGMSAMARGYTPSAAGVELAPPLRDDWSWSAGAIVSTARDLIKWDDALLAGKIVPLADVVTMRTSATLANGKPTSYGYGWIVDSVGDHPRIWHNGGTFGFHAVNATFPHDDEAIVVLENSTSSAGEGLASAAFAALHPDVAAALSTAVAGEDPKITARLRDWLHRFETGDIDRSQLTAAMSAALTPDLLAQTKAQFAVLGAPRSLVYRGSVLTGGDTVYSYVGDFPAGQFLLVMTLDPAGKIAGYFVRPA